MPFNEEIKASVKRKAHFHCCLCRNLYVEVHHIEPEAEGGANTDENAAPLCPSCHEAYGANAQKRKFIREARDLWYEICEKRFAGDADRLAELSQQIGTAATKADLEAAVDRIAVLLKGNAADQARSIPERRTSLGQTVTFLAPGVGAGRRCKKCGSSFGLLIGDTGRCPQCDAPW